MATIDRSDTGEVDDLSFESVPSWRDEDFDEPLRVLPSLSSDSFSESVGVLQVVSSLRSNTAADGLERSLAR